MWLMLPMRPSLFHNLPVVLVFFCVHHSWFDIKILVKLALSTMELCALPTPILYWLDLIWSFGSWCCSSCARVQLTLNEISLRFLVSRSNILATLDTIFPIFFFFSFFFHFSNRKSHLLLIWHSTQNCIVKIVLARRMQSETMSICVLSLFRAFPFVYWFITY